MDIVYLNACFLLNKLSAKELVVIAKDALKEGYKAPSLISLAKLDESELASAPHYFKKVLKELGTKKLNKKEAGIILARKICKDIISGVVDPYHGARKIWTEIWEEAGYPDELSGFVNDATDYEENYPRDLAILESIKQEAKKIVESSSS